MNDFVLADRSVLDRSVLDRSRTTLASLDMVIECQVLGFTFQARGQVEIHLAKLSSPKEQARYIALWQQRKCIEQGYSSRCSS